MTFILLVLLNIIHTYTRMYFIKKEKEYIFVNNVNNEISIINYY